MGVIGVGWGSMVQVPAFRAAGGYEVAALCSRRLGHPIAATGGRMVTTLLGDLHRRGGGIGVAAASGWRRCAGGGMASALVIEAF